MGTSKKDKDPSRADRKAKKRKLEDAIPDLPGDDAASEEHNGSNKISKKRKHSEATDKDDREGMESKDVKKATKEKVKKREQEIVAVARQNGDEQVQGGTGEDESKEGKREKKSKKPKNVDENTTAVAEEESKQDDSLLPGGEEQPRKSKKERKAERKAAETAQKSENLSKTQLPASLDEGETGERGSQTESAKATKKNNRNRDKKRRAAASGEEGAEGKAARFIVFIGNLPFTATTESIEKHFAAVHPKSVRHLTKKEDPSKSRGCAFLEFEGYDHMKTCLKLFHHSNFDDGLSAPRKINVELTAGGGGKTKHRTEKIGEKNQKLNEQRIRRMHEEEKAKLVKKDAAAIDHNDVHPSRRARVPDVS